MTHIFDKFPSLSGLKSNFPKMKAIFFDMDGTLFDTEIYHTKAMLKIGAEYKIKAPLSADKVHELLVGKADYLVYNIIKDWVGFPNHWSAEDFVNHKNLKFLEIIKNEEASNYFSEELSLFLNEARRENLFIALVTSSEKLVTFELLKLASLDRFFDLVLTRDDCPLHKPDPWPYLEAKKISNCSLDEIVIFEDSEVGIKAANATGAHVVKVEWY